MKENSKVEIHGKTTLIYLLFLIFISCGDNTVDKASEFIEISDYINGIELLQDFIKEHPRNIEARRLLIQAYDETEKWEMEIEQMQVISNLDSVITNKYRLMRLYAQTEQWDKLLLLKEKFDKSHESLIRSILESEILEFNVYESYLIDSLGVPKDSLFNDAKYDSLAFGFNIRYDSVLDSLSIDLNVALGLYALNQDERSDFTEVFKKVVTTNTTYRRYLVRPILDYLDRLEKPELKYNYLAGYYYDLRKHHNLRAKLYAVIGQYDKAVQEYDSALYYYGQESNPRPAFLAYKEKIDFLQEIADYEELQETVEEFKKLYGAHIGTYEHARLWIARANKNLAEKN